MDADVKRKLTTGEVLAWIVIIALFALAGGLATCLVQLLIQ